MLRNHSCISRSLEIIDWKVLDWVSLSDRDIWLAFPYMVTQVPRLVYLIRRLKFLIQALPRIVE